MNEEVKPIAYSSIVIAEEKEACNKARFGVQWVHCQSRQISKQTSWTAWVLKLLQQFAGSTQVWFAYNLSEA